MVVLYDLLAFALFALFFAGLWLGIRYLLPGTGHGVRFLSRRVASVILRRPLVAGWIQQHRPTIQPYLPVLALVVAAFVVAMFAGDAFLDLAEDIQRTSPLLHAIDSSAHDWAVSSRNEPATHFFILFTDLGGPFGQAAMVTIVAVLCAWKRRWRWMAYLLVTSVGGGLLDTLLKLHFARARPAVSDAIRAAHGFSFPSGHAMGSIVTFGALAYLATRVLKTWPAQSAAIALAITVILSVGISRVYIGVHWISDIAAGYAAGLLWLTACTVGYETLRRIRALRAKVVG